MYRQTTRVLAALLLAPLVVLALTSCEEAGTDSGSGGSSTIDLPDGVNGDFELSQLVRSYYGGDNTDLDLFSSNFPVEASFSGTGSGTITDYSYIWFEFNDGTNSAELEPGSYNVVPDDFAAGNVSYVGIRVGADYDYGTDIATWDYRAATESGYDEVITGGTVTVAIVDDTYQIEWNLSMDDGDSLSGTYSGPVDFSYDFSE